MRRDSRFGEQGSGFVRRETGSARFLGASKIVKRHQESRGYRRISTSSTQALMQPARKEKMKPGTSQ